MIKRYNNNSSFWLSCLLGLSTVTITVAALFLAHAKTLAITAFAATAIATAALPIGLIVAISLITGLLLLSATFGGSYYYSRSGSIFNTGVATTGIFGSTNYHHHHHAHGHSHHDHDHNHDHSHHNHDHHHPHDSNTHSHPDGGHMHGHP